VGFFGVLWGSCGELSVEDLSQLSRYNKDGDSATVAAAKALALENSFGTQRSFRCIYKMSYFTLFCLVLFYFNLFCFILF
jgi:hypothetical protein